MSEPIYMSIQVGGEITAELAEELLGLVKDEINDTDGPTTLDGLRAEKPPVVWRGCTNYGECDDIKHFCEEHDLPYIHHCEATGQYDAATTWWLPGMKAHAYLQTDSGESPVVDIELVRAPVQLLLAWAKDGPAALPAFIGSENDLVRETVEKELKRKGSGLRHLRKTLEGNLPGVPEIPPLTIKE